MAALGIHFAALRPIFPLTLFAYDPIYSLQPRKYCDSNRRIVWRSLSLEAAIPCGCIKKMPNLTDSQQIKLNYSQESILRSVIESIKDGIYTLDREGKFTFVNQFIVESSGYPTEAFLGRSYLDFIRPEDRKRVNANFEATLSGYPPQPYELIYVTASGDEMSVEVNSAPLVSSGEIIGVLGISRNVQKRRQAELALRESEENYRTLVKELPHSVAIVQDGKLVMTNDATRKMLNFSSVEQLVGVDVFQFIPEENRELFKQRFQRRISGDHTDPEMYTTRLLRTDGEQIDVEMYVQPIRWQGRTAIQYLVVDISERLKLEQKLRHTQKMEAIGTLAGGIAHDFNNLMCAILGMTSTLRRRQNVDNTVEVIEMAATRAAALTRQLLDFASKNNPVFAPSNMNKIVCDVLQIIGCALDKNITVQLHPRAEHSVVHGDAIQLQQVVLNLAINARDAMPEGGRLAVETRNRTLNDRALLEPLKITPGEYLEVIVADTGIGIADAVTSRIFEPFFTTKSESGNSGMGLSVVYGIIRNHRGAVSFECPPEGGTRFTVLLPVEPGVTAADQPVDQIIARGRGTILFVDDEELMCVVASRMLEDLGYRVFLARSGDEAIDCYRERGSEIDVVVLDYAMPHMNGEQLFHQLRALYPKTKILLSSGHGTKELIERMADTGCCGFLAKPYTEAQLSAAIEKAMADGSGR